MGLLKQHLNKSILFLLLLVCSMYSCSDGGDIIIKLPNSFRGYGALIFEDDDNCQKTQKDLVVFLNNNDFAIIPNERCVITNDIDRRYKFEMVDSTGKYHQICPTSYLNNCENLNCNTYNNLYHNGGSLVSMNSKNIVIFHIGHCDDPDSLLYLNSRESIRFREMLDEVTSNMK